MSDPKVSVGYKPAFLVYNQLFVFKEQNATQACSYIK